jgi:hypothetical protein
MTDNQTKRLKGTYILVDDLVAIFEIAYSSKSGCRYGLFDGSCSLVFLSSSSSNQCKEISLGAVQKFGTSFTLVRICFQETKICNSRMLRKINILSHLRVINNL